MSDQGLDHQAFFCYFVLKEYALVHEVHDRSRSQAFNFETLSQSMMFSDRIPFDPYAQF